MAALAVLPLFKMMQQQAITNAGFVIFGSQYRQKDEFGGKDLKDVITLVDIAKQSPNVNKNSISMMGVSRGSMMTYMAARQLPELKSLIIWAGASDLEHGLTIRPAMARVHQARIPNYTNDKKQQLRKRSALFWANELNKKTPILLLHGDADKAVDVSQAQKMAEKLTNLNHPHKLTIYKNDGHGLRKNRKEAYAEIVKWLEQHS